MTSLLDDASIVRRILDHIDHGTTDLGDRTWCEPTENYRSPARLALELERVFKRTPTPFCPSVALAAPGSYVAHPAAGVPLIAVRGRDGKARVFRNACRHRGAQLACGAGRENALVCPYHGWTYGLDGGLLNVPHPHGFPGLDLSSRGLVEVGSVEHSGLVFVSQSGDVSRAGDLELPSGLLGPNLDLVSYSERDLAANWKLVAEGFLEGYHIYGTHRNTFYPHQYDNLNVIETFGRNSRVTFPFRSVEKLRDTEVTSEDTARAMTCGYFLFPNVQIATVSRRLIMTILEPMGVAATKSFTYVLAPAMTVKANGAGLKRDADFFREGAKEDQAVVESIQRGLPSLANDFFEFGLFESAIVHFHSNLHELIGQAEQPTEGKIP